MPGSQRLNPTGRVIKNPLQVSVKGFFRSEVISGFC